MISVNIHVILSSLNGYVGHKIERINLNKDMTNLFWLQLLPSPGMKKFHKNKLWELLWRVVHSDGEIDCLRVKILFESFHIR